ncbi:uncharacterized protein LOC143229239 isoform X2 [Tachypleus tridentatus]|uniref:uncharacterized protein LOC143229239 isoform X2 n=1 Tax=Tachypleus tridentatus TaxID=6853 RepID=UPI003FD61E6F
MQPRVSGPTPPNIQQQRQHLTQTPPPTSGVYPPQPQQVTPLHSQPAQYQPHAVPQPFLNTVTPQQQIPQQAPAPRPQYGPQSTISSGQPPPPVAGPYESYQPQQQYSQPPPAGRGPAIIHQPQYDSAPQPGQTYPPQPYTTTYSPATPQPPGANPYSRGPQSGYPRPVQAYQQGYQ